MEIPKSFLGYKRENGRAGTRNHVIILPVDDISNACAEAVANNIKGTIALPHSYFISSPTYLHVSNRYLPAYERLTSPPNKVMHNVYVGI